jgi:enamine deaminase RidA (YjgF/YER057c/UK114 family)
MSNLRTYEFPRWGHFAAEHNHYTQAIRVENRIYVAGQGGWHPTDFEVYADGTANFPRDIGAEIDQAFENQETNLKFAGGKGWSQVYKVTTYSTNLPEQHEHIVRNLKKWLPDRKATWTEVGVKELGAPNMRFEVEVEAYDPEGASEAEKEKQAGKA